MSSLTRGNLSNQVKKSICELQYESWKTSEDKGWHEPTLKDGIVRDASLAERLALIHAETSEALEEVRKGKLMLYYEDGKPEGLPIELADIIIRVLDLAEVYGLDLSDALDVKTKFNKTRSKRHGNKQL